MSKKDAFKNETIIIYSTLGILAFAVSIFIIFLGAWPVSIISFGLAFYCFFIVKSVY